MTGIASRLLPLALLSTGLVGLSPNPGVSQTLDDFKAVVAKHSANSPAGGPGKNPDAAVFVLLRGSRKLCWVADGKLVAVTVQPTAEPNDAKTGGPTPPGEYLIGKRYTHEKYKIDWYKLYPRTEDNAGYYAYTAMTKSGRFAMGLHPGSVSEGCVTVRSTETPYDKAEAWKTVRGRLDSSKLTYKNDAFSGFLYVDTR
jgi:hypothetical protein